MSLILLKVISFSLGLSSLASAIVMPCLVSRHSGALYVTLTCKMTVCLVPQIPAASVILLAPFNGPLGISPSSYLNAGGGWAIGTPAKFNVTPYPPSTGISPPVSTFRLSTTSGWCAIDSVSRALSCTAQGIANPTLFSAVRTCVRHRNDRLLMLTWTAWQVVSTTSVYLEFKTITSGVAEAIWSSDSYPTSAAPSEMYNEPSSLHKLVFANHSTVI